MVICSTHYIILRLNTRPSRRIHVDFVQWRRINRSLVFGLHCDTAPSYSPLLSLDDAFSLQRVACNAVPKKSKKRPNRSNAKQVNKAKQVQLLQKQQQQESSAAGAAAKAGRSKHAKPKPPQAVASSAINGGGNVSGGHAPTGAGPPAHPWDPKRDLPTRGLLNLGNTCFFNSALQNVFKARLLHESLFADGPGRREGEYIGPLTKAFRKVLLEMTGEGPVGGRRG